MPERMALYMQDKHPIQYELEMAQYAEQQGFSEIWQADTRLARDCIVLMSAFLSTTKRLRLGSGVLPIWTRNAAVIAASWSTMWELAGKHQGQGRVMLGLGAWWEPISSRVGVQRHKVLQAMREYVEACRALFTMDEVTYQGEFVRLDRVRLDVVYGDTSPRDIPIYIGATGDKMLELSGEIADGVVLNYVVSPDYIRRACERIGAGAQRAGRDFNRIDRPELIVCALSDANRAQALDEARALVANYLGQEPHIMQASGVDRSLIYAVQQVLTWPPTKEGLDQAMRLIPDDVVQVLCAAGTSDECQAKVAEYVRAGCTCPILYPLMPDIKSVVDAFSDWTLT